MSEPSESNTLQHHIKASIWLGLPLIGAHLAQMAIGIVDTIMLGWLGVKELAAGVLAFQTFFIFLIFGLGLGAAIMPLVAGALGREEPREVRRSTRMGLWALLFLSIIFMLPLWFTEEILLALGQKPELAELADGYMKIAQWSLIPAFLIVGLRNFLTSIENAQAVLWFTIATAVLNGILNYAFIFGNFGAPRLEMQGAAVATLLANLIGLVITVLYVWKHKSSRDYEIFTRLWRPDWPAFNQMVRIGTPISFMIFAEAGLFSASSVLMGWLGTIPLAAHGVALQIASVAFMIPLGLSQAVSVRVGRAAGRGDRDAVSKAGNAVIVLVSAFAFFSAIVLVLMPEFLIRLFLDKDNPEAAAVVTYAVPLLWMAAAFQLVDGLQAAGGGALRGLSDTKIPMVIATIAYWPVGLSVAWILGFPLGFGGAGIWAGLVAGLAAAAFFLIRRFWMREELGLYAASGNQLA